MKENESYEKANNSNINNNNPSQEVPIQSDILSDDFFSVIKTSKKINDKKKKIDELAKSLKNNPSYINLSENQQKLSDLYKLLISNLNENNNNYVSSQIQLIDILINNNKSNNNIQEFKNFAKMALPKLFDKYYLQNQKINENLTGVLGKLIDSKILSIQDYYPHIENISLEEEDNYKNNIMSLLNEQIEKNKEITAEKIPKGIIDIVNRLSTDEDENVSDIAKKSLSILNNRKEEIKDNNSIIKKENEENKKDENEKENINEIKENNDDNNIEIKEKEKNKSIENKKDIKNEEEIKEEKEKENDEKNIEDKNKNIEDKKEQSEDINNKEDNNETKEVKEVKEEEEIKEENNDDNIKKETVKQDKDSNDEIKLKEEEKIKNESDKEILNEIKKEDIKKEEMENKEENKEEKKENENKEKQEEKKQNENIREKSKEEEMEMKQKEEDQIKGENKEKETKEEEKNKEIEESKEKEIKEENKDDKDILENNKINNILSNEKENEHLLEEIEENQITEIPEINIDDDLLNVELETKKENVKSKDNITKENKIEKEEIKENKQNIESEIKENDNNILSEKKEESENIKENNKEKRIENIEDNNNIKKEEPINKDKDIEKNLIEDKNKITNENVIENEKEEIKPNTSSNQDLKSGNDNNENNNENDNKNKDIKKDEDEVIQKNENNAENELDSPNNIKENIAQENKINQINEEHNKENIKNKDEITEEKPFDIEKKLDKKENENAQKNEDNKDIYNNNNENKNDNIKSQEKEKQIEKKESNNNINNTINNNNNQEEKKDGGLKRSAIQGKLNKFRKQFGKKKKTSSIIESVTKDKDKETDNSNKKQETNNDNNINANVNDINNNINNNLEENKIGNENNGNKKIESKKSEKNIEIKNNEDNKNILRASTIEEMFKKKIEDGFNTEIKNILDLGENNNNNKNNNLNNNSKEINNHKKSSKEIDILNEIQDKLGIDLNDINQTNNNLSEKKNNNENTDKDKDKDILTDKIKNINIFDNDLHDSKKFVNPDDRPIHPSASNNFNFDLDFDEQEKIFQKQESNKKAKAKKLNSSKAKNFFEDKDLEKLGQMVKNNSDNNNKKNISSEIEYKKKKSNKDVNPFDIENILQSGKSKDEKEINNITNTINDIANTINNLEHLNIIKKNEKNEKNENNDERRPKIKVEDFQKKLELALEQEHGAENAVDIEGNKDNENEKEKENKCIEDPRFDDIKSKLGNEIVDSLMSKKWESKKHGFELINKYIEENELKHFNLNDFYEYIRMKLKNFKETNFNVNREALNVFVTMTKKNLINKDNLISILLAYYDKITDIKLKDNYIELFNSSLSHVEPNFILKQILMKISKKNNAKLFIEYSLLFGKIIELYNNKELPYKELTEFCKIMANNSNPQSRNAGTNLICILYKYYGEEIHKLIKDIKESTLKNIEAELSKITVIEKPNSHLKSKKSNRKLSTENISDKNGNVNGGEKELNGAGNSEIKANVVVDISKKITPQILKSISDGKWAEKKEACEQIEKILIDSKMRILPNGLNDLMNLIKKKLGDGNKNIVRMMVNLLTQLIESLKQGFKQWSKYIALNLIPNLSDKNQILRNECQICFDKWVEFVGFDNLIIYFPPFLKNDNVEIRTEIMNFIIKYKNKFNKEIGVPFFKEMVSNLLLCLQDRAASVRNQAEESIKLSLNFIKLNNYYSKIKEYKPAITNDLKIILDKIQDEINGNNSAINEKSANANNNTNNNNSNIKENKDNNNNNNNDDFDIENEGNININELINSNNNKNNENNGNGASIHKNNNKSNSGKKKEDANFLKSNSTILTGGDSSRKLSINSNTSENKKFKKTNKSKNRNNNNPLNTSTNLDNKSKEKDFNEKANKTKDLASMKGSFKTCSNFNKKKTIDKDSSIMKSGNKETSSKSKILKKMNEKAEKSVLSKSINVTSSENNSKTDRTTTTKKLGLSKLKGISNSLILKKSDKQSKKEGNSIFLSNIKVIPNKPKRLEKDLKYKFSLDYITRDTTIKTKLKDICKNLFAEEFHKKIFNDDFKKQVMALKEMKEQIDKKLNIPIYLDNLDLILKVYGIYLNGNLNPTLVKNLLEFLDSIYNIITEKGYVLNEIETNIILSLLIDKLSINNNAIKEHLIKLLNEFIELNDINKIMILVLNVALGKNSKIKTEILDFTIELCTNKKLNIVSKNYIKIFGKYICTNDSVVKSKALILIKILFSEVGEELFVILDFLTDKDKKFLENNLFSENADFDDEEEEVELDNKNYFGMNSSDDDEEENNQQSDENTLNQIIKLKQNDNIMNIANGAVNSENELLSTIDNLLSSDETQRLNTIIILHETICQKYNENKKILIPNIEKIIDIFIRVTHQLFISSDIHTIQIKFAKYISTVLLKTTANKELIANISYNTIYKLTMELLSYLLIPELDKLGENQEGNFIFRAINSSMLRVIENCDQTSVILAFLQIVKKYQNNLDKRIASLAVKCLLKSIQKLNQIYKELNLVKIFNELHLIVTNYEKIYPDLKGKNQTDTLILRFIKNFVISIVKLKKEEIMEIYNDSIKKSEIEDIYIIHWIKGSLENLNTASIDKMLNNDSNNNINQSENKDNINNSYNDEIKLKENKNEEKENEKKIEEKNNKSEVKDKVKNKENNKDKNKENKKDKKNDKGGNTIDNLKKKWNDVKFK